MPQNPFDLSQDRGEGDYESGDLPFLLRITRDAIGYLKGISAGIRERAYKNEQVEACIASLSESEYWMQLHLLANEALKAQGVKSPQTIDERIAHVETLLDEAHWNDADLLSTVGPSTYAYSLRRAAKYAFDLMNQENEGDMQKQF